MNKKVIETLQNKGEDFIALINTILIEVQELEKTDRLLIERDRNLRIFEDELKERERNISKEQDKLGGEKDFIDKANKKIAERELSIKQDKDYLKDIEVAKGEWEDRKKEAIRQEAIIEEKIKRLSTLKEQEKALEERESKVDKEKAIDAERKRLLDVREERIKIEEKRYLIEQAE